MLHSLGSDWCIAFHPLLGQLGRTRLASIGHWNEWFSFPDERNGDEPGKGLKFHPLGLTFRSEEKEREKDWNPGTSIK